MELQDEGVPVDNTNLGAGEDQPHDMTMGPQGPDTYDIDILYFTFYYWVTWFNKY